MAKKYTKVEPVKDIWLPEKPNDELLGKIVEVKQGDYGSQYSIEQSDGERLWTPSHKMLQKLMENASVGEDVKIVFVKTEPSKQEGRNPTQVYDFFLAE